MASSRNEHKEEPEIEIHSIDADGCTFTNHSGGFNQELYQHIATRTQEFKGQTHFICGSNRQSISHDINNSRRNSTPRFFQTLEEQAELISKGTGKKIILSKLLLPDIYNDVEVGSSWINDELDLPIVYINNKPVHIFDYSKVVLLFAQMHYYSHLYPGKKIIFNFYDDLYEPYVSCMLYRLYQTFSENPELIPSSMELRLHAASSRYKTHQPYVSIHGKQDKPCDLRHQVKAFAACLGRSQYDSQEGFSGSTVIYNLKQSGSLPDFLASSTGKSFDAKPYGEEESTHASFESKSESKKSSTEKWIEWLEEKAQVKKTFYSIPIKPGQMLYAPSGAKYAGKKLESDDLVKQIQYKYPKKISKNSKIAKQQLCLEYEIQNLSAYTPQEKCKVLKENILNLEWHVNASSNKYPKFVRKILDTIGDTEIKGKNWEFVLRNIQELAEKAAAKQTNCCLSFFGQKRHAFTQAFYVSLANKLPKHERWLFVPKLS